jgi:hypothetical protein
MRAARAFVSREKRIVCFGKGREYHPTAEVSCRFVGSQGRAGRKGFENVLGTLWRVDHEAFNGSILDILVSRDAFDPGQGVYSDRPCQ